MKIIWIIIIFIHIICVNSSDLFFISDHLYKKATTLFGNDLQIYLFSSNNTNDKFLPEVGNGHIASQIRNDWIFMNGLYNGFKRESHRASIPSSLNWNIQTMDKLIRSECVLDTLLGIWKERFIYSHYNISVTTFASRNYRQILVKNVSLDVNFNNDPVIIYTNGNILNISSPDIEFSLNQIGTTQILRGRTNIPENNYTTKLPVFMIFEDIPRKLVLNFTNPWISFVTAIDEDELKTWLSFDEAISNKEKLLYKHAKSWIETWDDGLIQIINSDEFISKSIHAAQYYILSSLPFKDWSRTEPSWQFYGLSPGGLAHGNGEDDYMGHVFWDMDTWIYPAILPFHRMSALEMLKYRLKMLSASLQHSKNTGYKGSRYPWESARTGFETSPSKLCGNNEIHVSADISYAFQQFLWIESRLEKKYYNLFFKSIIENIAEFWESRITIDKERNSYEILNVMPPDEYVHSCNNSAFTNMVAKLALQAPSALAKLYGENITSKMLYWTSLAHNLKYVVEKSKNIILEHDGYKIGTIIKQADVMLLNYPFHLNISQQCLANSQSYYQQITDSNGPAMTWAIYSINWFYLNNLEMAESMFKKNFGYINLPFYVWSESIKGAGAINFHTGMGGYLQNIINGFMGMRLYMVDHGKMIINPSVSTIIKGINMHNIKFQGSNINISFNNSHIILELLNDISVIIYATKDATNYKLSYCNKLLVLDNQEIVITSVM